MTQKPFNPIKPSYYDIVYSGGVIQTKDLMSSMNFCGGNAFKYIIRHGKKDAAAQDLCKALQYVEFMEEYGLKSCWLDGVIRPGNFIKQDLQSHLYSVLQKGSFSYHIKTALKALTLPRGTEFPTLKQALKAEIQWYTQAPLGE